MKKYRYRKTTEKINIKITVFNDGKFIWNTRQWFKGKPSMSLSKFLEILDEIKKEITG
jgi:hypothetical protein